MRFLILSCNTGQGHNSVAAAIRSHMERCGIECDVEDSLKFISDSVSRLISGGHVFIYRNIPALFRFGYNFAELHREIFKRNTVLYRLFSTGSEKLYSFVKEGNYDAIICVHAFSALMITDVTKRFELNIKTCFIATDYTCSPSVDQSDLDYYFIPSAQLVEEFSKYKINVERIKPSGIPIRSEFFRKVSKETAKREFMVAPDNQHLLMMCGSMGCGPMRRLAELIESGLSEKQEFSIVCGTNEKLYDILVKKFSANERVHIYGYVDNVSEMLDSVDLYITKPGGISVTEAAVKCVPMIFIDAVAGCEKCNLQYYTKNGGAVAAKNVNELVQLCFSLLDDKAALKRMADLLEEVKPRNASEYIKNFLLLNSKMEGA